LEKLLYEEPEALETLGLGKTLFRQKVAAQEIPCVRIGRRKLYPVAGLREFVAKLQAQAAGGR